jgi:hypothetical protein
LRTDVTPPPSDEEAAAVVAVLNMSLADSPPQSESRWKTAFRDWGGPFTRLAPPGMPQWKASAACPERGNA